MKMQFTVYNQSEIRKRWFLFFVFLFFVLVQCFVISMYSAQTAEASTRASDGIVEKVERLLNAIVKKVGKSSEDTFSLTYIIRKAAHFYNFAILGILFCVNRFILKNNWRQSIVWAFMGIFVAATDELHQYFVPGRSMQLSDVFIDFSGVLFGMSFMEIMLGIIVNRRKHGKREENFKN